jgi:hypothetical protein
LGGTGGGGDGATSTNPGSAGAANTGGGGGGSGFSGGINGASGAGGSGVVIFKLPNQVILTPGASHVYTTVVSGNNTTYIFTAGDDDITIG